jgi:hypothetical protein
MWYFKISHLQILPFPAGYLVRSLESDAAVLAEAPNKSRNISKLLSRIGVGFTV